MKDKEELINEIRYTIRLTERTARLYRHIQTFGIFMSIVGGSAAMASLADDMPKCVAATAGILLTLAGALLIAIKPADKAAQNEADVKRYQLLRSRAVDMNSIELEKALEETRTGDAPEVESLRAVAYNDVVMEINQPDYRIELSLLQRILRSLA